MKRLILAGAAVAFLAATIGVASHAASPRPGIPRTTPPFELPWWDAPGSFRLADLAGKIIVLDFFAYWCTPCHKASAELEQGIRRHYLARKGNPAGIPVEVVSINVEAGQRDRTSAFIKRHQLPRVVHDPDGKTLDALGGKNLPYIVVLDGSRVSPSQPEFPILYRHEGFEGSARLRAIIDAVKPASPPNTPESDPSKSADVRAREFIPNFRDRLVNDLLAGVLPQFAALDDTESLVRSENRTRADPVESSPEPAFESENPSPRSPLSHRSTLAFEGAFASDVDLTQTSAGHTVGDGTWEAGLLAGLSSIGLDYRPVSFDFLGVPTRIDETRAAAQFNGRLRLHPRLSATTSAGLYRGFTDFRSAWLSEYYRQQFSSLPGYLAPTPAGHFFAGGLRWEYLPATGYLQIDYSYLSDEIAPGYEIDFDGLRSGRPYLYSHVVRLSLETIVSRRLRLLHEFRRIDTSDREQRLGYQGSANLALSDTWTVRLQGGLASEQPTFDAWYLGGTIEHEWQPGWFVSATGRYYQDTGEIENSNFSNAAPALQAWKAGLGLRYSGERWSFKLFAAPYATRYAPSGIGTAFFQNLYRNRDWGLVEAAVALQF